MAGPAVRCWEFARVLSHQAEVTLATPYQFPASFVNQSFKLETYDASNLKVIAHSNDVIIISGYMLQAHPFLKELEMPLVVDLYDPFQLESFPLFKGQSLPRRLEVQHQANAAIVDLIKSGDFFLCASERQRDYWLGWLSAFNRVNTATYDDDPSLRHLIDVVAFGIPDSPPVHINPVMKGVHPKIGQSDKVIVWGGGIYNWFDPLTLIRAMASVRGHREDVKLVFMGIRHPNSSVVVGDMVERAIALSQELGLYETTVFFRDWTPYTERQNYLLEADIGVSLHFEHIETRYSFRTRLLDYIWAALPMIVTRGDVLSEIVEREHLGWVVDYGDVQSTADAILRSCEIQRGQFVTHFKRVAQQLTWTNTTRCLQNFCAAPYNASDKMEPSMHPPLYEKDNNNDPYRSYVNSRRFYAASSENTSGRSRRSYIRGNDGLLQHIIRYFRGL
jgi:glycosyltransferase involved in cell wall biosynthesis